MQEDRRVAEERHQAELRFLAGDEDDTDDVRRPHNEQQVRDFPAPTTVLVFTWDNQSASRFAPVCHKPNTCVPVALHRYTVAPVILSILAEVIQNTGQVRQKQPWFPCVCHATLAELLSRGTTAAQAPNICHVLLKRCSNITPIEHIVCATMSSLCLYWGTRQPLHAAYACLCRWLA